MGRSLQVEIYTNERGIEITRSTRDRQVPTGYYQVTFTVDIYHGIVEI